MKKHHSNSAFNSALNKNGIDLDVTDTFDDMLKLTIKVPGDETLIKIPNREEFPLELPESSFIDGNIENMFVKSSLKCFSEAIHEKERKGDKIDGSIGVNLENILPFDSSADFVRFKRELQTYYHVISEENDLEVDIQVCKYPSCLNSAVPSFSYCCYHLPLDESFSSQPFLSQCDSSSNGNRCETPCSRKYPQCVVHKRNKKQKSNK